MAMGGIIREAREKVGLWLYQPHVVLEKMRRMEAPQRLINPKR
jgi:hypothetical protein